MDTMLLVTVQDEEGEGNEVKSNTSFCYFEWFCKYCGSDHRTILLNNRQYPIFCDVCNSLIEFKG